MLWQTEAYEGCSGATCCNQRDYCRGVGTQSSGALVRFPGGSGFHQVGTQPNVFYLGQNHGPYGAPLNPGPRVSADPTDLLPAGGPGSREDAACCHHGTRTTAPGPSGTAGRKNSGTLQQPEVLIPHTSAGAYKPNWSRGHDLWVLNSHFCRLGFKKKTKKTKPSVTTNVCSGLLSTPQHHLVARQGSAPEINCELIFYFCNC